MKNSLKLRIGDLSSAMTREGYNQSRLAKELKISRESVSKWLKGEKFPRPDRLLRLGMILTLNYEDLVVEEEPANAPVVAFRKKGNRKTKPEHIQRARDMGLLVEKLVPYLPFDKFERPATLRSPVTDYRYLQELCLKVRADIGVGEEAIINFEDLINKFNAMNAVLVPVLWGEKEHHENALHIYLPESMTAWVFINLDPFIHDFKFWIAHELGHVYTPQLVGDEGEDFADAFAQSLLFPERASARAYKLLREKKGVGQRINAAKYLAEEWTISPNTIIKAIQSYAQGHDSPPVDFGKNYYGAVMNFNKDSQKVSDIIFGNDKPSAREYIDKANEIFKTPFFYALGEYLNSHPQSLSFVRSILQMPITDAKALVKEL